MKLKQKHTQSSSKKILISAAIIIVLVAVYGLSAHNFKLWPFSADTSSQKKSDYVSPEEVDSNNNSKQDLIENQDNTSDGTPSGNTDDIVITTRQENGSLVVMTKLYGYSDGQCSLKVTNGTQTATQSAVIIFQTEYSSCAGFSVNIDELGTGTWDLSLTVTSKSVSTAKQVSVEVK